MTTNFCPICARPLGNILVERHHLVPKTFKGKELISIHKICHVKIHSVFTERELLKYYFTADRIREREEMQTFISWVANKPPEYYVASKDSQVRKSKRK